jgi:hypothetical protein
VALLGAKGITGVLPLEGGIDAWLADNSPFVIESLVKKRVVLSPTKSAMSKYKAYAVTLRFP